VVKKAASHSRGAAIPTVSALLDMETGQWRLFASSYGMTTPAGPRLFRGGIPPALNWVSDTQEAANAEVALLTEYLNSTWK